MISLNEILRKTFAKTRDKKDKTWKKEDTVKYYREKMISRMNRLSHMYATHLFSKKRIVEKRQKFHSFGVYNLFVIYVSVYM